MRRTTAHSLQKLNKKLGQKIPHQLELEQPPRWLALEVVVLGLAIGVPALTVVLVLWPERA